MFNDAHGGATMATAILRLPDVRYRTGLSRSTIYLRISQGFFPAPISLGGRTVGWPDYEIDEINAARIAGTSDDEIGEIVERLHISRGAKS